VLIVAKLSSTTGAKQRRKATEDIIPTASSGAREIRKQNIFDMAADGIDPEIAALMYDFGLC